MVRARGLTALLFAIALVPAPLRAQPAPQRDETTVTRARQLGEQGLELFDRGDYAGALARLEEADALVRAPTLGLFAARCLVKLGRWGEAAERYAAVTRTSLPRKSSSVLKQALVDAEKERAALLANTPTLEIGLEGTAAEGATVELDGAPLDPKLIGQKRSVDPGPHRLRAARGDLAIAEQVDLAPGESRLVVLRLIAPVPAPERPPPVARAPAQTPDAPSSIRPTLGYVALATGAVGLAVWAGTGLAAVSRADDLGCDGPRCPATPDDVSTLNGLRIVSTVGFWAGLGFGALGAALLVTAPPRQPTRGAVIQPWIGIGAAGTRAVF